MQFLFFEQMINYGPTAKNRPRHSITIRHISSKKLKMTAEEMTLLIRALPVMIGDLIPTDRMEWTALLNLKKMERLLSKKSFDITVDRAALELSIQSFHMNLQELGVSVTPKAHYLIHASNAISKFGPLHGVSSMRFESKHCDVQTADLNCKKNVPKTLAIHSMLKFAQLLTKGIATDENCGGHWEPLNKFLCNVSSMRTDLQRIFPTRPLKIKVLNQYSCNGDLLSTESVIALGQTWNNDIFFHLVKKIFVAEGVVHVLVQHLNNLGFNSTFNAYEVGFINENEMAQFNLDSNFAIFPIETVDFSRTSYINVIHRCNLVDW
jgi:hypothetical protein